MELNGKVVLITGAGKGSGRHLAGLFASRGFLVAVCDLTPINLDETVSLIAASGNQVRSYVADIAKKLPIQGLLNQVLDDFGRLDILVNCAEVEPQRSILDMDEWEWVRTLDVNLTGAFLLTQSAARIMQAGGGGVIIHLGTRAKSNERHAAYFASKAGLQAMISSACKELSPLGIRVLQVGSPEAALEACLA